jgi:hypothetical protein
VYPVRFEAEFEKKLGVEVFLRVREAKTKKNAILWTPNVTVVPALGADAQKSWFSLYMER